MSVMLVVTILGLTVASAVASGLPTPKINYLHSGAVEISVEGAADLRLKHVTYSSEDHQFTGPFHHTADGQWYHRNYNTNLHKNTPVRYTLVAEQDGTEVSATGVLSPEQESGMPLPPQRIRQAGRIVFRDDFSSSTVDRNNWNYEVSMYGGYNGEFQVYTNDHSNVFTRNGNLYIKPTFTVNDARFDDHFLNYGTMDVTKLWGTCTNHDQNGCLRHGQDGLLPPVMSGRLTSTHTLKYGKIEVRAKIPRGDWIWPAIWMLPKTSVYGGWPRSGDIDIMESRGNTLARSPDGINQGNNQMLSKMNWGSDSHHDGVNLTYATKQSPTLWSSDFHVYSLDWTADHITIKVDDAVVLHVPTPSEGFWNHGHFPGTNIWASGGRNAPFDAPFYLILSVAIGGTNGFFEDNWTYASAKPWHNTSPTAQADFWRRRSSWEPTWKDDDVAMIVDYVQMTQY